MRYAKARDGQIEYAPKAVRLNGHIILHPTAADYALFGYLPVVLYPEPAVHRNSWHWELGEWVEVDGEVTRLWKEVKDPPAPPRIFSKLKVVAALMQAGVWPEVKEWIERAGLYDLYLAAQEFAEDNEYFAQGLAALKPVVGWTDEQVEALLAQCVKEGV